MFRATILTVVLVFAAGPSASLFCKAWCDPQVAAESGCHHDGLITTERDGYRAFAPA